MDRALAALCKRSDEMLRLTRRLVEQNSFTENVDGANRVAELLREAFSLPPLSLKRIASTRFGEHLVWRTRAVGAPILLIGHHDTVFPEGHFEGWREENGRAIGPGVLDMKGGLAVIWGALATLDEMGALANLPLVVVSVSDEEVGSPDSTPHLKALAQGASCALVFESGRPGDIIVTRRRGTGGVICKSTGKAAHAGNAHAEGVNAIWALSKFVDAAQSLTNYSRGLTVNCGKIIGGTSKNTVPEKASCELDIRFESQDAARELMHALQAVADQTEAAVPGAKLALSGGPKRMPLERTTASVALYAEYAACQRVAGLGDGESPLVGGGSDANTVSEVGVPAIDGLGPRGEGYHTTQEYAELASFHPKAEALLRFLWGRLKS